MNFWKFKNPRDKWIALRRGLPGGLGTWIDCMVLCTSCNIYGTCNIYEQREGGDDLKSSYGRANQETIFMGSFDPSRHHAASSNKKCSSVDLFNNQTKFLRTKETELVKNQTNFAVSNQ